MRIFITGASGFVGGAIARRLASTHFITAMSRSEKSDGRLLDLGVTPVRSTLGAVTQQQLQHVDVVIHCAAFVKQWGTREQFWDVNVRGTRQLIEVARRAGVRRFIHIGTEAALVRGQALRDIDETYPYPASTPFLYAETKREAEKLVLAANAPDFATVSIRPRFVWGPGDETILPVLTSMVRAGRFVWIDDGRSLTSTTHIDNLVAGVTLALTRGRGGEAYFIVDEGVISMREFLAALLATQNLTPPDKSIPGFVARGLAMLVEGVWRLLRITKDPPLTRLAATMMSTDCTIRSSKAATDLDYRPVITRAAGLQALRVRT